MKLILGTRGSPLALAQARMAASALEVQHSWPANTVQLKIVRTTGDRIQDRPLSEVGGKGLWTKELDQQLLAGETHASVHSMKDVESERPPELQIAAMLKRGDTRDRLIGAPSIKALPLGARIGTSSPRRAAQLRALRPDLTIVPLRGNVETRLAKLKAGECDATLLAAAGLDRLERPDTGVPIALLPAPAQGAIGIECRAANQTALRILARINHQRTAQAVLAERAFTRALGGSCHSPVAALATVSAAGKLTLKAEILSEDGSEHLARDSSFAAERPDEGAALAHAMLAEAPESIRRLFEGE